MMHAVIRNGVDALHLIGAVDGYTLEALKEHTSALARGTGTARLEIEVTPEDEVALARRAGRWLLRLAARGVAVEMREHPPS
ncbi:MAG: hypothetical protein KIT14_05115 [bacterium]|nr:hypothetical protein [bacterium]